MKSDNIKSKEKVKNDKIILATKYENIKSKYILEQVFNNLENKKRLKIVKYNKNMKKRINININDYKEYSEKYSSIEIEIRPVNNKDGTFINFKKDEKYYHIYFNNNKEEIKRTLLNKEDNVSKIWIKIVYQILLLDVQLLF